MHDSSKLVNVPQMPNFGGKKEKVVGSKVSFATYDILEAIAQTTDRTVSYLVRELMMRGLAQFYRDGEIRLTSEDEAILSHGTSGNNQKPSSLKPTKQTDSSRLASRQEIHSIQDGADLPVRSHHPVEVGELPRATKKRRAG